MNNKINYKGYVSLLFFLSESMFLGVGINQILNTSENNSILSIFLALLFGILIIILFNNIFNYKKDLNIINKINNIYGNILGNIINFILFLLILFFFIFLLWDTEIYIQNKYLDITPSYMIGILFLIPIIYIVNNNFNTICKLSLIIFFISLIEIMLSILGIISYVDIDNFKPIFSENFYNTFKSSIYYISFFFSPLFLLLIIPKNYIDKPNKINKNFLFFYFLSFLNLLLLFLFIIGVFGIDLAKTFNYPEFVLIKKINFFNFIEHIENILSTFWMYCLFISSTLSLYYIKTYLNYKKRNNFIFYLIIFICFFISLNLFKNTTSGYNFIKKYFHILLSLPLFILLIISSIIIKKRNN